MFRFLQDVLMGGGRKFKLSVLHKNCDRKRHAVQSTSGCGSFELHVHTGNMYSCHK